MLVASAALSFLLATGAYFIPFESLVPHYGNIIRVVEPFETWSIGYGYPNYGGNPHTLFAAAALILACVASMRPSQQSSTATSATTVSFASGQVAERI
jgi:hypothetical protein